MFHPRSSAFASNVSALEGRLRALEKEMAGQRTSAGLSSAGERVGDAIASAVTEILERLSNGRRLSTGEAAGLSDEALKRQ
jgi:hypothetical protein